MNNEINAVETFEPFDAGDHLRDELDARALLEVALEESVEDPTALPAALGIIARSGNMSALASEVGMSRDGLYTALSENGNPTWSTLTRVLAALDLEIKVVARSDARQKKPVKKRTPKVQRARRYRASHKAKTTT
ncbi:addiction module antidote protein [Brachybacterium paraconglomeratum]|uniref:addiction module antidote protein n=1 Tax=Brachybacterium paraconglomeratum TaxID=173362 RepID=UPI003F7C7E56